MWVFQRISPSGRPLWSDSENDHQCRGLSGMYALSTLFLIQQAFGRKYICGCHLFTKKLWLQEMGSPLIRFGKRSPSSAPLIRFGRSPASAPLIRYTEKRERERERERQTEREVILKRPLNVLSIKPYLRFGRSMPDGAPLIRFGRSPSSAPLIRSDNQWMTKLTLFEPYIYTSHCGSATVPLSSRSVCLFFPHYRVHSVSDSVVLLPLLLWFVSGRDLPLRVLSSVLDVLPERLWSDSESDRWTRNPKKTKRCEKSEENLR